jgi:hypothetical protein
MWKSFLTTFGPSPRQVRVRQLHDAQVALLHHAALAEHHEAMTRMYRERCERLALDNTSESRTPFMVGVAP